MLESLVAAVLPWLAAAGGALALIVGAFLRGRAAGTRSAQAEAARRREETRRAADDAARDAERDGASGRLRDGRF